MTRLEEVIVTEELTKVYGRGASRVVAVDRANLVVRRGSVHGIVGPNGAGKTTLISMLVGLTVPTSGTGRVLGHDIVRESREIRERVGLLPEGYGFYDDMTARENLAYIAKLNGLEGGEASERIREVLEVVGLSDAADKKVKGFSRGMKQRLGIAQALLKDPEILILDEPTMGLDPGAVREFRGLVRELVREGKTIVMCTHLLREIGELFTDATVMVGGRIVAQGALSELRDRVLGGALTYAVEVKSSVDEGLLDELRELEGVVEVRAEGSVIRVVASSGVGEALLRRLLDAGVGIRRYAERELSIEEIYEHFSGGGAE
ncbi:MAG: ABC transporter ATP-binding protein [Thermoprotei archaeon]|nr:MAG: ABC transporter ATP-binding protein [Thermoprotei archaeon]